MQHGKRYLVCDERDSDSWSQGLKMFIEMICLWWFQVCLDQEWHSYRVDRIKKQPEILKEKAVKKPKGYNVSKYTTEVFRMFSTDEAVDVTLRYGILTLKTSDSFFRSFCFLRQNEMFSATEQNQMRNHSFFLHHLRGNPNRRILVSFLRCGFLKFFEFL